MTPNSSFRVLRDPNSDGGGGAATLSPDQQKIADATAKVAASQVDDVPARPVVSKPIRNILKAPPKETLEGKDFSVDADAPEEVLEVTKPLTDTKPALEKDKKVAPVADTTKQDDKKDEKKEDSQQITLPRKDDKKDTTQKKDDKKPAQRDYSGYSEAEVEVLKQMSNPAFEFATSRLKELKELRDKKPDSYLQHPQGYILSPDYNEAVQNHNLAQFEYNHYKTQLINLRAGKKWTRVLGYKADGSAVLSEQQDPTEEADVELSGLVNYAQQLQNQFSQKADQVRQGYTRNVEASVSALNTERAKRFEWVAKPELLDSKIEIEGMGEVPVKKVIEDFKSFFAPHFRGSPILDLTADMFVAVQLLKNQIKGLQSQLLGAEKLRKDVIRAEPVVEGGEGGAATVRGNGEFSTDGMPE